MMYTHEAALLRIAELRQKAAVERQTSEVSRDSHARKRQVAARGRSSAERRHGAGGAARAREDWSTAA